MSAPTAPTIPLPQMGTPAPWFKAPVLDGNPDYSFNTVAGRPVLMLFMGSASHPPVKEALDQILMQQALFDDANSCFFGVSVDPRDVSDGLIASRLPGIRYILDGDLAVSRAYGAAGDDARFYQPYILVLDHQLRIAGTYSLSQVSNAIARLQTMIAEREPDDWAPVLKVPRVFEPEICRELIRRYEAQGGEESGFMREVEGKTVQMIDHNHKKRSDYYIEDQVLCRALAQRLDLRLRPALQRAFQFDATRLERYIIACYDADVGGYFRPHRDNTTKGTAHRRFAVTINLNAEDYEGGDLRFPEFGQRSYRAPTGGAIVFSCSLLHEATPVTSGRRYAFLPFLYDDAAAAIREANNPYLGDGLIPYSKG